MSYRIYIPQEISEGGKKYLREKGYDIVVGNGTIEKAELEICDGILLRTCLVNKEIIDAAKKLKVISRYGVGYDNVDIKYCQEKGIWVTYAPISNYISVAEHTIMLLLMCAKNFGVINSRFRTETSDYNARNTHCGVELEGKILGIFGLGKIGREVAKKAAYGFGMKVICYDPFVKAADAFNEVTMLETKEEVIKKADFISLHMPNMESTKGFFGIEEFKQMKDTACFINAARGEVVVEKDLTEALEKKYIAGAAIDVYIVEPPDSSSPIFKMDNVIITPHNAGVTKESLDRMGVHAAIGIDEVLTGKAPTWPVNHPISNK